MSRIDQLKELLKPVVEGLGCDFWGVELLGQGHRTVLRVYIDRSTGGGVTIDDCEKVSRQVSAVLDVEDVIASRYTLEVSSPGWDRPLFEAEQYPPYIGETLEIRLQAPFEGRRKFKGVLLRFDDDEATLQVDGDEVSFPIETIEKARIVPQIQDRK